MIVHALDCCPSARPAGQIAGFDPEHDLDADGTYLLGLAYTSVGWPEFAITFMKRSTTMAPNRTMFLVGLGESIAPQAVISETPTRRSSERSS